MSGNYTLGRGKLYFDKFEAGTKTKTGERYIGNTPEINYSTESELLEHFDSDAGIRQKDDQVILEITRTLTFITDNIDENNLALFFLGEASTYTQTAHAATEETIENVQQGLYYQLGVTDANPQGLRGVSAVAIEDDAMTPDTFTVDVDYTLDAAMGRIYIKTTAEGGGIANDTNLVITRTTSATARSRVLTADSVTIDGALRYISANPKGTNRDAYFPYVQLTPNGDFAFKGDEWAQLPFTAEVLKLNDTTSAAYLDGRPA